MKLPRQIANRYVRALADLTEARGETEEVKKELGQFVTLLGPGSEAHLVFASPAVPRGEKRAVLDLIIERARPLRTTENFLRLLLENRRLTYLAEVVEAFADELDRRAGVVNAEITTASPLADEVRGRVVGALENKTGRRIRPVWGTDPDLIGGVRARVGSLVFDGSVRAKLDRIRERMTSEAGIDPYAGYVRVEGVGTVPAGTPSGGGALGLHAAP